MASLLHEVLLHAFLGVYVRYAHGESVVVIVVVLRRASLNEVAAQKL